MTLYYLGLEVTSRMNIINESAEINNNRYLTKGQKTIIREQNIVNL